VAITTETKPDKPAQDRIDPALEARIKELVDRRVNETVSARLKALEDRANRPKRLAIAVVSRGTIDAAYPAFILATAAAALEMEVGLYFSFFGLNILKKRQQDGLKLVPLGNPALPLPLPNIIAVLPGVTALATTMMKRDIKKKNIATVPELIAIARETGVRIWPCQMAMDMFGLRKEDLIDGLPDPVGAATFLEYAGEADITLFI
jgi:peroxiredoxin family protein